MGSPTSGKIRGIQVSASGALSSVVWSLADALAGSGTYAYLQNGASDGTRYHVLPDTTSVHQSTSGVRLENGDTVAIYTRFRGVTDPSRLVAQRISSAGAPLGPEISIRPDSVRPESQVLLGQVLPLSNGFAVIYKDGSAFGAIHYDNNGVELGRVDLGDAPAVFQTARGAGDEWSLAQAIPGRAQIRVRTFDGLQPSGADATVDAAGLPAQPTISLAMQESGNMMLAWNLSSGSVDAALLSPAGSLQGETFRAVTTGGVANSVALASDYRGNFVMGYEQAGNIHVRIYDGTQNPPPVFPALASITAETPNSNICVNVSESGALSVVWIKASSGNTQDIVRRDFQISYE